MHRLLTKVIIEIKLEHNKFLLIIFALLECLTNNNLVVDARIYSLNVRNPHTSVCVWLVLSASIG